LTTNRPSKLGGSAPAAGTIRVGLRRACRLSKAGVAVPDSARARPGIYQTGVRVVHQRSGELAGRLSNGTQLRRHWRQGPRQP